MRKSFIKLVCVVLVMIGISGAFLHTLTRAEGAEEAPTATQEPTSAPQGEKVQIKMEDDVELVGLFYATAEKAPAVLLLHDGVSSKIQWVPFVPSFTEAGYNVLVVDLRGMGESNKGPVSGNSPAAQDKDIPAIVAWLRQQPTVDPGAVALIGARLGANFAIRACAADDQCHTVIGLTPSTDFFGIKTEEALKSMKKDKAVFLVATQYGESGEQSMKALGAAAPGTINFMARVYGLGFDFGTGMFKTDPHLMDMVLLWLKTYNHS